MSAKAIFEAKGKALLNASLGDLIVTNKYASVSPDTDWDKLLTDNPWLQTTVSGYYINYQLLYDIYTVIVGPVVLRGKIRYPSRECCTLCLWIADMQWFIVFTWVLSYWHFSAFYMTQPEWWNPVIFVLESWWEPLTPVINQCCSVFLQQILRFWEVLVLYIIILETHCKTRPTNKEKRKTWSYQN